MSESDFTETRWGKMAKEICDKNATPIISNQLILNQLFGKEFNLAQAWANTFKQPPFPDSEILTRIDQDNLTRAAQFLDVTKSKRASPTKEQYLTFLKRTLRDRKKAFDLDNQLLEHLTFSKLAIERLEVPIFKKDSPLMILANLNFPLYLTTSPHRFMEAALRAAGKPCRTEVFSWSGNIMWEKLKKQIKDEYKPDMKHESKSDERLVYHLHGIDDCPDSLVLTEDDHLQFLVQIRGDKNKPDIIPSFVPTRLSTTLLLLLGYEPYAWDLRVLLKGMIEGNAMRSTPSNSSYEESYAIPIHIVPSQTKNKELYKIYLEKFFDRKEFYLIEDDLEWFLSTLWDQCQLHIKLQQRMSPYSVPPGFSDKSQVSNNEDSA